MVTSQKYSNLKWTAFLFALLFTVSTTCVLGQQNNPLLQTPNGNWSFGIFPYHGSDRQDFPVGVWQVTSEIDAGVGATKIGIVNNSNKTVAAVKFKWLLFEGENRDRILQQGSTALLALRTTLEPERKKILSYQVTSLLKVYRPLLRNNILNGDFEAEILVEEVYFTDGSIWKKGDRQAKQSKSSELKILPASFTQCPKQKCKSNTAGTAGTVYYSCETSTFNEVCSVAANARSCTMTNCGSGGGGGIEPEVPIEYNYP